MPERQEQEIEAPTSFARSRVRLTRPAYGRPSWQVTIVVGDSEEEIAAAVRRAIAVDEQLGRLYPEEPDA